MIWGCSSLIDQRLRHIDLFADGAATVESFLQQDAADLAAFLRECHGACGQLEGWAAGRSD